MGGLVVLGAIAGMIVLVVAVIAGIILLVMAGIAHGRRTDETWARAARSLGLVFQPGGLFSSRKMHGAQHGLRVELDTYTQSSGENSTTYTRFRVWYPRPLELGLRLTREGFFTGVTKLFGAQDIEVGDGAFDADVLVKGSDPRRVREFLTPARRMRIHRFLNAHRGASIDDHEIAWNTTGVIRDHDHLVSTVQALVRLGWHLVEDRERDRVVDRALLAQEEGDPDAALRILRGRGEPESRVAVADAAESAGLQGPRETSAEPAAPAPVEEQLLEGEILYLGGRRAEAHSIFERASHESPHDDEIREWTALTSAEPAPHEPTSPPSDSAPPVADPGKAGLDPRSVCEALFGEGSSSLSTARLFEREYAGRSVRWTGVLRRADNYGFDMVFGAEPGCKAVVDVHELGPGVYGKRGISAIVRFPRDAVESLRRREGQPFTFTARLEKADGLMRNVYLTGGEAVE